MKVVLLKDLKGKGKKGDVITVSDGYAANYLIPNNIAIAGNSSNLNEAKQAKASADYQQQQNLDQAHALAKELKDRHVEVKIKSGQNGKIFGSVTNKEVCHELEKMGYQIDKKKIELENIKVLGTYTAKLKLYASVAVNITVNVVAE